MIEETGVLFLCLRCCCGFGDEIGIDETRYPFLLFCDGCARIGGREDFVTINPGNLVKESIFQENINAE